jgi:hypothetical protein
MAGGSWAKDGEGSSPRPRDLTSAIAAHELQRLPLRKGAPEVFWTGHDSSPSAKQLTPVGVWWRWPDL